MYSYNLLNSNMLLVVLLHIIKTYCNSSFHRKFITFFLLSRINGSFYSILFAFLNNIYTFANKYYHLLANINFKAYIRLRLVVYRGGKIEVSP